LSPLGKSVYYVRVNLVFVFAHVPICLVYMSVDCVVNFVLAILSILSPLINVFFFFSSNYDVAEVAFIHKTFEPNLAPKTKKVQIF
jgi:hypothetical protein